MRAKIRIDSDKGLEALTKLITFGMMFLESMPEEGQIGGYDALIVEFPDLSEMLEGMELDEDAMDQMDALEDIPPLVCVAVPGYILMSDQPSMEALIGIYEAEAEGTGRLASLEFQVNWDLMIDNFSPDNPGMLLDMIDDPDLKELISKFYSEVKDLKELGMSLGTIVVTDSRNFELDILTTRESLKVLEAIEKIVEETPDETWEKLGEMFGEAMMGQGGMGAPVPDKEFPEHGIF